MKKLLLLALLTVPLFAQINNGGGGGTQNGSGAPTGSCSAGALYTNNTSGEVYGCQAGSWLLTGPGAAGATNLNSVLDPTANKAFTMGAFTLNFNTSSNSGASNPFSFSDFATNTGTGYLFSVSSGASSAIKPFRVCYQGTSNCINMDTTTLTTSGTVVIDATKLSGNLPALNGASLTNVDAATLGGKSVGTLANNIVALDGTAKLPAVDGSQLTNLPSGFANPMTTAGDIIYGGVAGAPTRLAGPTTDDGVPWYYTNTSTAGVAGNPTLAHAGVPINAQTGTTYTIDKTDRAKQITASNAGAQTYTAVNPSTSGFGSSFVYSINNIGAGAVTENASGFTLNGGTSLVIPPNWVGTHYSDNTNYQVVRFPKFEAFPNCQDSGGNHLNFNSTTGVFSCGTSTSGGSGTTTNALTMNNSGSGDASGATFDGSAAKTISYNTIGAAPAAIATGTAALGTGAIASGACATVVTVAATGVATTDTIVYTPNADPTGVTGYAVSATGSLYIWAYPTANNVNFKVCNNTSGSLTPGALTLNWRVSR